MGRSVFAVGSIIVGAAVLLVGSPSPRDLANQHVVQVPRAETWASKGLAKRPLVFEQNRGQTDSRASLLTRAQGYTAFLTSRGPVFSLLAPAGKPDRANTPGHGHSSLVSRPWRSGALSMYYGGGRATPVHALGPPTGTTTYLKESRIVAPTYPRAIQRGVYPGIDVLYLGRDGELRYDWLVSPGASPNRIKLELNGAEALRVDRDGSLVATVNGLSIRQRPPVAFQHIGGAQRAVTARWSVSGLSARFELGRYDRSRPLVIDPTFYNTFGGSGVDTGLDVDIYDITNPQSPVLVGGVTGSPDFPMTSSPAVNFDAFAAEFTPNLTHRRTFIFGGSRNDSIEAVLALNPTTLVLAGGTNSPNFPLVNAFDPTYGGGFDSFVTVFNPSTGQMTRSSYWGGTGNDTLIGGLELPGDTFGLYGYSSQAPFGGPYDAQFGLFDPTGGLRSSRFLGGSGNDGIFGGTTNGNGIVLAGGSSASPGAVEGPTLWFLTADGEPLRQQRFEGGTVPSFFRDVEGFRPGFMAGFVEGPFPGRPTGNCFPPACGPVGIGAFRLTGSFEAALARLTTYVPPGLSGDLTITDVERDAFRRSFARNAVAVEYTPAGAELPFGRLWGVRVEAGGVKLEKQLSIGTGSVFPSGVTVSLDGTTYLTGGALPGSFGMTVRGPLDAFVGRAVKFLQPCTCTAIKTTGSGYGDISSPGRLTRASFRVNWEMFCSAGDGNCNGEIRVVGPGGDVKITQPRKNISCKGTCRNAQSTRAKGSFMVRATSRATLTPENRAGKRFVYKLHKWCIVNGKRVTKPFSTVVVAYNAFGSVDRRNSDLNGNGRPDSKDPRKKK